MRRAAAIVLCLWAVGTFLSEPLLELSAGLGLLLALVAYVARGVRPAAGVRLLFWVALAYAGWQLSSPVWALATGGAPSWPRGSRYAQVADTFAFPALLLVTRLGVPWRAVGALLASGWVASAGLGIFQHLHRFDWTPPAWLKLPVWRMHEDFSAGGRPRYPAGGFFFHRLRLAHGAVAMLGPALALALRGLQAHRRVPLAVGLALACALLVSIYLAFARAALGAALGVVLVAGLLFTRGWLRRACVAVTLVGLLAVAASPEWRARVRAGVENLAGGERQTAMSAGWNLFQHHPLFGVGFGNHQPAALARTHEVPVNERLALDAHNLWITVAAETGCIGAGLALAFHVLLGLALWRRARTGDWRGAGGLLAFAGWHVLSLVHYLPFHSSGMLTFAFVWALALEDAGASQGNS